MSRSTTGRTARGNARLVVQTWLGTRLVIVLVGVWLMVVDGRTVAQLVNNWDVVHFLDIAKSGYAQPNDVAFFPGWPLLLRCVALIPGVSLLVAGTVLALVASGIATAALYRMYGTGAAVAWLFAPTAVFTMVPYTESVFCAAAFWAWERATAKQWGPAAALAAVAASVRISGLFLVIALAVLALTQAGSGRARVQRLGWLVIPVAVIGAYATYLWRITGSWTAWYHAQATGWSRSFTEPWISLQHTIEAATPGGYADQMGWAWMFRAELVSMAVGVVIALLCLFRKRLAEAVWVGSQVAAFSVSYWFMSVNRAVLLWFPLWEQVGRLLPSGRRTSLAQKLGLGVAAATAVAVQAGWAWLFFTGQWSS